MAVQLETCGQCGGTGCDNCGDSGFLEVPIYEQQEDATRVVWEMNEEEYDFRIYFMRVRKCMKHQGLYMFIDYFEEDMMLGSVSIELGKDPNKIISSPDDIDEARVTSEFEPIINHDKKKRILISFADMMTVIDLRVIKFREEEDPCTPWE